MTPELTKGCAEERSDFCKYCSGQLVRIRGRYPKEPKREVCPTCLAEKMDDIKAILNNSNEPKQDGLTT
jgi:hypothetical protein